MFILGIVYPSEEAVLQRQGKKVVYKVGVESVVHETQISATICLGKGYLI